MAHKFKRIISLMLALLMMASCLSIMPADDVKAASTKEINGHKLISSLNSKYNLYIDEEDLSLVVEDKATGAYMESAISFDDEKSNWTWLAAMKSAVVITMISGTDDTKQADLINDKVDKKITYTNSGFSAKLYWTKYKFGLTLEVSFTDEGLVARVADDSIVEESEKYQIGTIQLYPYMGTSYLDTKEGYIFIPDGNGALIYLDDKEGRFQTGFSSMIYGKDYGFDESNVESLLWDQYKIINEEEKVLAPIYGIAHTDDRIAYLAVVEDGVMRASIEAAPNGVNVNYNRAYARFIERKLYKQPTSNNSTAGSLNLVESDRTHSDLQVRFLFLTGDQANYAGMAGAYRDYLLNRGDIQIGDNSYNTRIDFLGTEREKWIIGTSAVVMTTVDDIRNIYSDLESLGVTDIMSVYKGWQAGGLYKVPIGSYKADSKIGGTKKLTSLIKESEAKGIKLYLYDDALRINPSEKNATFDTIKKINKRKFEEESYKDVYKKFNYLTPAKSLTLLNKLMKSYSDKGVNNLCISGITNSLFSYTYSGNTYSRFDTAGTYKKAVSNLDASMDTVLEQPFAYLWGYTESFLDMPLYTSSYVFEDEFVPFMSIVLKGVIPVYSDYVNFEANKQEFFLKLVETGSFPSFYITQQNSAKLIYTNSSNIYSSQYSSYKDTIVEYSKELSVIANKTEGAFIVGHDINGKITKVTYSNGVKIYINYGDADAALDGINIPAKSYKVD